MAQVGKPRGVVNPRAGAAMFRLALHPPAPDLAFFVEHYWVVTWDLRGCAPYLAETLPHPCVHLVIEEGHARVVGVVRGRFSRLLAGQGRVFGIKFKPGAFYPFIRAPVSAFTDRALDLHTAFGPDGVIVPGAILALTDEGEMVAGAETFLRARRPERDALVGVITTIIDGSVGAC